MRQISHLFFDERLAGFCTFCGSRPDTGDHAPPKVFLDRPYPQNLAKVGACFKCNNEASIDEEYVACALEAAVCNSVDPDAVQRPGIAKIFRKRPNLAGRIGSMLTSEGLQLTREDATRISRVLIKTARALWTFETAEPTFDVRSTTAWQPLPNLSAATVEEFFAIPSSRILPELGSRMSIWGEDAFGWVEVQEGRFSYLIDTAGQVRMLVRGYLAAQVDLEFLV